MNPTDLMRAGVMDALVLTSYFPATMPLTSVFQSVGTNCSRTPRSQSSVTLNGSQPPSSWSAGTSGGYEFNRWAGTEAQQKAAGVIQNLSRRYWDIKHRQSALGEEGRQALTRARALILEAQTSCFLFWGDSWIPHLYKRTIQADRDLAQAENSLRASQESM